LFKGAFDYFGNSFYLLLLSSIHKDIIKQRCMKEGIPGERLRHLWIEHSEMNNYLNIADFGFAPYKQTSVSIYLSPVKVGEYWACGLPVLITDRVGDESNFLELEKGGIKVTQGEIMSNDLTKAFERMDELISDAETSDRCVNLAKKFRSGDIPLHLYGELLKSIGSGE